MLKKEKIVKSEKNDVESVRLINKTITNLQE